jgi:hypothetical protein
MSDGLGRKYLIYLTLFPSILTQLLVIYLSHPERNLGLGLLYADALLSGCLGGGSLLEPCVTAYVGKQIIPSPSLAVPTLFLLVPLKDSFSILWLHNY